MMKAPLSFAPPIAHKPIGPCAKTATVSPIFTSPLSAAEIPVDAMSASRTTCSSLKSSGMFARLACAFGVVRSSLTFLDLVLDLAKNADAHCDQDIAAPESKVRVLVVRAQEDWAIDANVGGCNRNQ
jgi:hypothetical protein